jgi:hypothetical protein
VATKVFRSVDRIWRVEVKGDLLRVYYLGAWIRNVRTPDELDVLMKRTSGHGLGDLIED